MARSYKRDANGRFAGGGGGGKKASGGAAPKSKSAATRAANKAVTDRLLAKGLTGTGSRLNKKNAALYSGSKATKAKKAALWSNVEGMQRAGASGRAIGAQRSKAKVGSTIGRRSK